MPDEMPAEQRDANAEIIERLARIEVGVKETNGRVTALEEWKAHHQPWSEQGRTLIQAQTDAIAGINSKLDRFPIDVIREVSGTLQAMVHEARDSSWKEDFKTLYEEAAAADREERHKDRVRNVKQLFTRTQKAAIYAVPFFGLLNIIGQWFNWW